MRVQKVKLTRIEGVRTEGNHIIKDKIIYVLKEQNIDRQDERKEVLTGEYLAG